VQKISIIIPTLNEATSIQCCLPSLKSFQKNGHEIIVVDGGSNDLTTTLAQQYADYVLCGPKGRAKQLNVGSKKASGDLFIFLHADTVLPEKTENLLQRIAKDERVWGRFDVQLSGTKLLFRIIEFFMNIRSRVTGIATGDQAIFVSRELFERAGGFPEIELMEDILFSVNLKKICSPVCLKEKVITSSRRWEKHGIIRTIFKMSFLRLRYAFGASPEKLARLYD